jgi:hypothetical protein
MKYIQTSFILIGISISCSLLSESSLFFREDWKEIPFALPITSEHVSNPELRMETHGPGKLGIKKSHHAEIENDPFYIWSGKCELSWGLSLSCLLFMTFLPIVIFGFVRGDAVREVTMLPPPPSIDYMRGVFPGGAVPATTNSRAQVSPESNVEAKGRDSDIGPKIIRLLPLG